MFRVQTTSKGIDPMNVLVAEDDTALASTIVQRVQRWGYMADLSTTGGETIDKISKNTFDLILLDIFLPDTTAHDLIPKIKEFQPGIGIVTMTGYNSGKLEREIREKGIIYYLLKPFNSHEVKEILDHISNKIKMEVIRKCSN